MKLTNEMNLPQPLVSAVENDPYTNGGADISVTALLNPPRQKVLERIHSDEITEDASDRIWSLMGQVVHGILERANTESVAERRLYTEVLGWKVSGGMDAYYEHGLVQDYKVTTAYKFKNNSVPEQFEQQLNLYAHILRSNGHKVTKLEVVGILRDWSVMEAKRDPNFPKKQVVVLEVPLWPEEKARAFLYGRVKLHQEALRVLPLCSDEDRWGKPRVYAVMKPGRKTAVKLHDSEQFAKNHAASEEGLYVVERPQSFIRCENYCRVANFCSQYKETLTKSNASPDGFTLTTIKGVI